MTEGELLTERDGPVARLTLNRPDRLNALTPDLLDRLRAALEGLADGGDVRAVVLTGAGRAFSSGADRLAAPMAADVLLREHYNPLIETMLGSELPIIAAINGVAAGAGASLSFACDLRVASAEAKLSLPFVKVGLVPDAGSTWLLPRIVGGGRAAEMALLGRPVAAEEALSWGLVSRVAKADEVQAVAHELAQEVAELSSSVGATKRALRAASTADLTEQLEREATLQADAQQHPDYAEARTAFKEKRPPRFGRAQVER
jgi:2-(1,2-epoxy-1,2-dihydrophenyl)acetyl-CoA isomerase